jgi:hypothetical protein
LHRELLDAMGEIFEIVSRERVLPEGNLFEALPVDINDSEVAGFSEVRDDLRKSFVDPGGLNEPEFIRMVADLQEASSTGSISRSIPSWERRSSIARTCSARSTSSPTSRACISRAGPGDRG